MYMCVCLADSEQQAKQASVEGNKSLQDKAKENTAKVGDFVRGALQTE